MKKSSNRAKDIYLLSGLWNSYRTKIISIYLPGEFLWLVEALKEQKVFFRSVLAGGARQNTTCGANQRFSFIRVRRIRTIKA